MTAASEKVSEAAETEEAVAEVSAPSMLPVVINFEIEDDDMPHIPLDGVTITGQYGDSWNGTYGQYWTDLIWEYVGVPAQEAGQFTYCMNACYSGYQGSLTTCLSAFGVGFALGTAACGGNIGCGEALGSLMMSTCMLGREIEYGNCKQGCINNYGT